MLRLIAAAQGVKPEAIERWAGDVNAVRPQRYVEPTPEELERKEIADQRREFAAMLAQAKRSASGQ